MMNAAMMIAPAAQMDNIPSGGKVAAGQGQLFGLVLAQQEQQLVYQIAEQDQSGLSGQPGKGVLLNKFSELIDKDTSALLDMQPQQQELLAQLDVELLDGLALLLEQEMSPISKDHNQLQQLNDLVEEVLPQWQFHKRMAVAEQDSAQELLPEQQGLPLVQQAEELIAWLHKYQEQQARNHPGQGIRDALPPGQVVAAQKLEQARERLTQLRATLAEAGNNAALAKTEGAAKGTQMARAATRGTELSTPRELPGSSLEARFSELLEPRQPQDRQSQAAMNARQGIDLVPQHNHLHAQLAPVVAATQGITAPTAVAAPFAASQQVADSQIFDQVVTHLSGSHKGDIGRMVLRLHPAELGALRIELMVEGDKVRANLHVQTQQVQEVLERNLGQLRIALAEQGLKIDHFQVSSDARQNQQQEQAEDLAHQRRQAEQSTRARRDKEDQLQEDQAIPLAHLIQNGGRGISLHV